MATFIEDLWNAVFTPGPTPTLLVATNAAFGGLQLILLALLVATFSIHFVVLSILCAGLWVSINWFAREVTVAQAKEEEEKRRAGAGSGISGDTRAGGDGTAADSGDDTETEGISGSKERRPPLQEKSYESGKSVGQSPQIGGDGGTVTGSSLKPEAEQDLRKRRSLADSTGDISTDSEWEKVEEET